MKFLSWEHNRGTKKTLIYIILYTGGISQFWIPVTNVSSAWSAAAQLGHGALAKRFHTLLTAPAKAAANLVQQCSFPPCTEGVGSLWHPWDTWSCREIKTLAVSLGCSAQVLQAEPSVTSGEMALYSQQGSFLILLFLLHIPWLYVLLNTSLCLVIRELQFI